MSSSRFHCPTLEKLACCFFLIWLTALPGQASVRSADNQTEDDRYQQAVALFNQRDWDNARAALNDFLKTYPRSRWLPAVKLRLADLEADPARAEKAYKDIMQEAGPSEWGLDARWALANHQYMLGRYTQAADLFLAVAQSQDPRAARALFLAGLCQQALKADRSAKETFQRATGRFPDSPWAGAAWLALGDLEAEGRHYPEAVAAYDQYLKAFPQGELMQQALEHKARVLESQGRHAQARAVKASLPKPVAAAAPAADQGTREAAGFTIQVGAFSRQEYAAKLKQKLIGLGYSAYTMETRSNEELFHQVRVGHYRQREAAERAAAQLEQKEKLPALIVPLAGPEGTKE